MVFVSANCRVVVTELQIQGLKLLEALGNRGVLL